MQRRKLVGFTDIIDAILEADTGPDVPRRQRHTAHRIFERLRDEHGFAGGYAIVKDYVRARRQSTREAFVPLHHPPGHAQVDFGEAVVEIRGRRKTVAFFCLCWQSATNLSLCRVSEVLAFGNRIGTMRANAGQREQKQWVVRGGSRREAGDGRDAKSWHSELVTGRETAIYRLFTLEEMRAIEALKNRQNLARLKSSNCGFPVIDSVADRLAVILAVPWARHGQPGVNGGQGFAEGRIEDGPVSVREQDQEFNRVVGRIDEIPHSPRAVDRDRLGRIEPLPDMSDARVVADASFGHDTAIFERRAKAKQLTA